MSAVNTREPDVQSWITMLRWRHAFIGLLMVFCLTFPSVGPARFYVAFCLAAIALPYNVLLELLTRERGRVPPAMAFGDPLLCAGFIAIFPDVHATAMVVALMDVAVAAVLFSRRVALASALTGFAAYMAVTLWLVATHPGPLEDNPVDVAAYGCAALMTVFVVGSIAKREQSSRRQLSAVVDGLHVVAYSYDLTARSVSYISPNVEQIFGYPADAFLADSKLFTRIVHPEDFATLQRQRAMAQSSGQPVDCEHRIVSGDGSIRWMRQVLTIDTDRSGRATAQRGLVLDITAQKTLEQHLISLAMYDSLTGLPNRALLFDRAHQALRELRRDGGALLFVFCDLVLFKRVNDTFGHATGDLLLTAIGERLPTLLRPSDTVARFGGDEFVIVATLESESEAQGFVERLLRDFEEPYLLEGRELVCSASLGAVVTTDPEDSPERLLLAADSAMYVAKGGGPGTVAFYDPALHQQEMERLGLERDLTDAVEHDQLRMIYQPIVHAGCRSMHGVEALLRWQHPVQGPLTPDTFLELAENTGHIQAMGLWVLDEVCRQHAAWRAAAPGTDLVMYVNVSARQVSDASMVDAVRQALLRHDMPASALCLEITETALIADAEGARLVLQQLADMGVRVVLDDFGTGYSSLGHLSRFPVDGIKIDKSFVARMTSSNEARTFVSAILTFAHQLGLSVVAEGVETEEQATLLLELGCGSLQGYLIARPAPPEELPMTVERAAIPPVARTRTVVARQRRMPARRA